MVARHTLVQAYFNVALIKVIFWNHIILNDDDDDHHHMALQPKLGPGLP
jgi:hypothetical protein